jgi:membrane fusion protein, multidrug efflux system
MKANLKIENNNPMKQTIYFRILVVVMLGALAACSATTSDDKGKQLESLRSQQAEIAKQIVALEKEIPADSAKVNENAKKKEVAVTAIVARSFDHYIQTQGKIEAEDNVVVSAKTPGLVISASKEFMGSENWN